MILEVNSDCVSDASSINKNTGMIIYPNRTFNKLPAILNGVITYCNILNYLENNARIWSKIPNGIMETMWLTYQ